VLPEALQEELLRSLQGEGMRMREVVLRRLLPS
jgi:hypothetical protein